jgi:hypothetical protein
MLTILDHHRFDWGLVRQSVQPGECARHSGVTHGRAADFSLAAIAMVDGSD